MKFRNQFLKYQCNFKEGEGEGEGGGAGGGEGEGNKPDVEALVAEVERLRKHTETLLGEKKAESDKRREAEAEAKRKDDEKALKDKDYEQLYKSSTEKNSEWETKYNELNGKIANEKKATAAMKIAADIADGSNAELLSTFISERLKYTDDGLKVTDSSGELTVSSLDDLKAEFKSNAKFASLIRGSQASGGGATGGKDSGSAAKEVDRATFDKMSQSERKAFSLDGGKITN